tara:strand:- start:1554 stop:1778 length:225 start_codon:yes stop_codon:yes gene_type:complete
MTEINDSYNSFIPDHPFIAVTKDTLENKIRELINGKDIVNEYGSIGRNWVQKYHDIKQVSDRLYNYYESIGVKL